MNKTQMVKIIVNECDVSRVQAKLIVDMILTEIIAALELGDIVKLVGFGIFKVRNFQTRIGYNPHTGEKNTIPSSKTPIFVFSKSLKKIVN